MPLSGIHLTTCSLHLLSTCQFCYRCASNPWVHLFVFLKSLEKWAGFYLFMRSPTPNTVPLVQEVCSKTSSLLSSWLTFPTITVYPLDILLALQTQHSKSQTCSSPPLSLLLIYGPGVVSICMSAGPGPYQAHSKYSENIHSKWNEKWGQRKQKRSMRKK